MLLTRYIHAIPFVACKIILSKEILRRISCKNSENEYGLGEEIFRTTYINQFPMQKKNDFERYNDNNNNNNNNNNNINNIFFVF
jgi:hypothetical protein